jgi:multidrug efflux pump subunit AcrB
MWLVLAALRRPITIVVAVVTLLLGSTLAVRRMQVDIFPNLGAPVIYVSAPYPGMNPEQFESFITYGIEYYSLYITGLDHVESKTIQGIAVVKLVFHPDANMTQALSEVVAWVNRARVQMPAGNVPPVITRFDAGSVPVAQVVFSSEAHNVGEMQEYAVTRVRPLLSGLPGVSSPPSLGASQRSIVVRLDPNRLRSYGVSPEEAIVAVNRASSIQPAGNVRIGDFTNIVSVNASIGSNFDELLNAPIRTGNGPTVYLRDIGTVDSSGTDITNGFAHVNGRRTVYLPILKRSDASTLSVIRAVRAALPAMRALVPDDVSVRLEFDQSAYVSRAIQSLVVEGVLGALLTGLMVLVFLRDWRTAFIVIATIPFALVGAVIGLWASNQTINIMTLGGLALAVGVLVDEATVEVENIHTHMGLGLPRALSVTEACRKTAIPRLLSMIAILSVFVPSFFMVGVGQQLFVPLSLAVGFAMVGSYVLSTTLVPVLSVWVMRQTSTREETAGLFGRFREWYGAAAASLLGFRWRLIAGYAVVAGAMLFFLTPRIGTELFPVVEAGQLQLRIRAKAGTRIERTELIELKTLDVIKQEVGPENVSISSAYIGTQPSGNPINAIYVWNSGPQEALLKVALAPSAPLQGEALKERLRQKLHETMPDVSFSFEPGDIVSQVMSFGSPTPVEVAVQGTSLAAVRTHAEKVQLELKKVPYLRDLQYGQALDYPSLNVNVDRNRAGQFGLTMANVARSLIAATSSSRFIEPNFWRDPSSGNTFQLQVQIPENRMTSAEDVLALPLASGGQSGSSGRMPLLRDVATAASGTTMGEIDRYNMQRVVSSTANISGASLGRVARAVNEAVARAGEPPKGTTVFVRGQIPALEETQSGLQLGLLLSIATIFLLLAAFFQSFRLALAILSTIPAVLCGVVLMLLATGTTLNVQSFMGAIMSIGIAVANAILFVTFAEMSRHEGHTSFEAAVVGGKSRVRAILMTATAMIAGMLPIALGIGTASEQTAPLGRAVIGGLIMATMATLFVLPAVYAVLQKTATLHSASLNPHDPASRYYVKGADQLAHVGVVSASGGPGLQV